MFPVEYIRTRVSSNRFWYSGKCLEIVNDANEKKKSVGNSFDSLVEIFM